MTFPHRETSESNGHIHTISRPGTGFTDPAEDGHKHALVKGCNTCAKIRATLKIETLVTSFVNGHIHFFNSGDL